MLADNTTAAVQTPQPPSPTPANLVRDLVRDLSPVPTDRSPADVPYSDAIATQIVEHVARGRTLADVSAEAWSPHWRIISSWEEQMPAFRSRLARARQAGAAALVAVAERAIAESGPGGSITPLQARDLAYHARWRAERQAPQEWGQRLAIAVQGEIVHSYREAAPRWLAETTAPTIEGQAESVEGADDDRLFGE